MNFITKTIAILFSTGAVGVLVAEDIQNFQIPQTLDAVVNYKAIEADVAVGGLVKDIQAIKDTGFKSVIDLRTPMEGTEEERKAFQEIGVNYINIPVYGIPMPSQVKEFKEKFASLPRPILVHCRSGARVNSMLKMIK